MVKTQNISRKLNLLKGPYAKLAKLSKMLMLPSIKFVKSDIKVKNEDFQEKNDIKSDNSNNEAAEQINHSNQPKNENSNSANQIKEEKNEIPSIDNKSKKIKKFHLTSDEINNKINSLEQNIKDLEGANHAQKRKRLYQKIVQLKKALENPELYMIDPAIEMEKQQKDKEKRTQKKLAKSKKLKEELDKKKNQKRHQICHLCKKRGHIAQDCKLADDGKLKPALNQIYCYKCGSKKHTLYDCPDKTNNQLRYATCFYCKQIGHISRDCPQNEKGIYFKGGSCFNCGSTRHLAKECPERYSELRIVKNGKNVKENDQKDDDNIDEE